ncbi:MAG TPA: hypothetical protein VGO84_18495, partial [Burkholderiales bacterium]|nr:hypothetical protein [Burkholderiales bacterium]
MNQPVELPDVHERISGFAYSGFQRNQDPTEQLYPSTSELNSDLALLGREAEAIRTYSSTDNANVPRLASDHGLLVTAGAWIDRRSAHNDDEIAALIRSVRENSNIERVIVGNEAILRGDISVADLIKKIKQVKRKVRVPVST